MASTSLLFVWHHKNNWIFNSYKYPFLHNILYHSSMYNTYVVYYVENPKEPIIHDGNVTYIDFQYVFPEFLSIIDNFEEKSNKIDMMKIICSGNFSRFCYTDYLLMMDMDCEIVGKIKNSPQYDVEPYFDAGNSRLMQYDFGNIMDSYIENYALLISSNGSTKLQRLIITDVFRENVSWVYEKYINFIIHLFRTDYNMDMPEIFNNNLLDINTYKINFCRGQSWNLPDDKLEIAYSIVDPKLKPIYYDEYHYLYVLILRKNIPEIEKIVLSFHARKYNFSHIFRWSNSEQRNVNIFGVIQDRIENYQDLFNADVLHILNSS